MQKIICAAIRFTVKLDEDNTESIVVAGPRHYDTVMHRVIDAIDDAIWKKVVLAYQGFLDNRGTFLTRHEAFKVATKAKQIIKKSGNPDSKLLFSEDLY